jgi:hypothetical protein
MVCQNCGVEASTKHVAFYQNIGLLLMRFHRSIVGNLCKSCIHKYFWQYTLVNLFLGWWGLISLIVTPFFLINNVFRYLCCLGMPAVPAGAARPQLTDEAVSRLTPFTDEIVQRLNSGQKIDEMAVEVAEQAQVSPGQVVIYVQALVEAAKQRA